MVAVGILLLTLVFVIQNYDVVFSEKVVGEIFKVEPVHSTMTVLPTGSSINPQLFSFAVGIKDRKSGQIWTASSEDRQWAIAVGKTGLCAEAEFLPYPPWNFSKKGTFHGARLIHLFECDKVDGK